MSRLSGGQPLDHRRQIRRAFHAERAGRYKVTPDDIILGNPDPKIYSESEFRYLVTPDPGKSHTETTICSRSHSCMRTGRSSAAAEKTVDRSLAMVRFQRVRLSKNSSSIGFSDRPRDILFRARGRGCFGQ